MNWGRPRGSLPGVVRLAFVDFRTRGMALAGLVFIATTSGCTSHHKTASPDDGSSASASAAAAALAELRHQASAAKTLSFTATYQAQGTNPPRTGTVTVFHTASATRIDVAENGTNVRIIVDDLGTFSCKFAGAGKTPLCVELAGPGASIPPSVDPGLQHLFTTALDEITSGSGLHVAPAPAPAPAPTGTAPAASCYAVTEVPSGGDLAPGTYCYADGMLVSAQFRSSSLQLTKTAESPTASDFALPASPAPLTSPSASPS